MFFFSSLFWTVSQALSAGGEGGGGRAMFLKNNIFHPPNGKCKSTPAGVQLISLDLN